MRRPLMTACHGPPVEPLQTRQRTSEPLYWIVDRLTLTPRLLQLRFGLRPPGRSTTRMRPNDTRMSTEPRRPITARP